MTPASLHLAVKICSKLASIPCLVPRTAFSLTTDGHKPYLEGNRGSAFGGEIDYAMLIKLYGKAPGNDA